jgi:hypothetical protein
LLRRKIVPVLLMAMSAVMTVAAGPVAVADDEVAPMIVGGHEATGDTGWMAAVLYDAPAHDRFDWMVCGGVLAVDRKTVITGGPCVDSLPGVDVPIPLEDRRYKVRLGSKDRAAGGVVVPVTKITPRPDWQWGAAGPTVPQADIAVLTLAERVDVRPLQLAATPGRSGERVSVFGWGVDSPDSAGGPTQDPLPRRLQHLDTKVVSNAWCVPADWSPKDICVANPNVTDGPCNGDFGDPVVRVTTRVCRSWWVSCHGPDPGSVARHRSWRPAHPTTAPGCMRSRVVSQQPPRFRSRCRRRCTNPPMAPVRAVTPDSVHAPAFLSPTG